MSARISARVSEADMIAKRVAGNASRAVVGINRSGVPPQSWEGGSAIIGGEETKPEDFQQ